MHAVTTNIACSTSKGQQSNGQSTIKKDGKGTYQTQNQHRRNFKERKHGKTNGASTNNQRHETICAAPLNLSVESSQEYSPPVYPKTDMEELFLYEALKKNFIFSGLSQQEIFPTIFPLIQAMEKVEFKKGDVIIQQGDTTAMSFYVVAEGSCSITIDGIVSDQSLPKGASFGELALLYSSPRAATIAALEKVVLFGVDQRTFRMLCQAQVQVHQTQKRKRLEQVSFLADLSEADKLKVVDAMTIRVFKKGDILQTKGEEANLFWIVDEGDLKMYDLESGGNRMADIRLEPGDIYGQHALLSGIPLLASVVANSDGQAFVVDKEHFWEAVGDLDRARSRGLTRKLLAAVRVIKNSMLCDSSLDSLVRLIKDESFLAGECIWQKGEDVEAALYFLRQGSVRVVDGRKVVVMEEFGFFGEDTLVLDSRRGRNGPNDPTTTKATKTIEVVRDATLSVLKLHDCRRVVNTLELGRASKLDSIIQMKKRVEISDFTKHSILGEGMFGQVWLVSRTTSVGKERVYALKVQSKSDLVQRHEAEGVVRERDIMAQLHHPFVTTLVSSFQDERFVYMLMDLQQGGELETRIHPETGGTRMLEHEAMFYAAGIVEGLSYLHGLGFAFRDLKPQNVLINNEGYPVIADFGFTKNVAKTRLTFTFCGTALYLAPEIILQRGHGIAVDHWSFGILICEMLNGCTPFDEKKSNQVELFRAIVQDEIDLPATMSSDACSLLRGLLQKNPNKRLGSLANAANDIFDHPWFRSIDFQRLRRMELNAPYVPNCRDTHDASNFPKKLIKDMMDSEDFTESNSETDRIFENF